MAKAQVIVRVSGTEPERDLSCKIYFGKSHQFLLKEIWEQMTDGVTTRDWEYDYGEEEGKVQKVKLEKFREMFFAGGEYDPRFLLPDNSDRCNAFKTTDKLWVNFHDFKLIAVEPYSSYEFHYCLGEIEPNEDGSYDLSILEH